MFPRMNLIPLKNKGDGESVLFGMTLALDYCNVFLQSTILFKEKKDGKDF